MDYLLKHFIKYIAFTISLFILTAQTVRAEDLIEIVEVKRNITLSDSDPVYKDYYLNSGLSSGLKKNLIVKVKRQVSVKNDMQKLIGQFHTVVGFLKIIHVEGSVAVAREVRLESRENEPMIEQIGIMVGDQIDLTDSSMAK